jgi:hypothetical protein
MARYFLHLRDGTEQVLDPEGIDFPSMDALRKAVLLNVRSLICGDVTNGLIDLRFRIDAENAAGEIVYTLPFKHAINVIPEG